MNATKGGWFLRRWVLRSKNHHRHRESKENVNCYFSHQKLSKHNAAPRYSRTHLLYIFPSICMYLLCQRAHTFSISWAKLRYMIYRISHKFLSRKIMKMKTKTGKKAQQQKAINHFSTKIQVMTIWQFKSVSIVVPLLDPRNHIKCHWEKCEVIWRDENAEATFI